ncbi:hypothetical protein [Mesoplasma seiffertii]|uniref:hypothetical protein n=1 Tax=Mesoplasma seiffertii TaxID=28224 RepID=UPI00047B08A9|nr:hypothetical protein [Mesoplasma seiffertii]
MCIVHCLTQLKCFLDIAIKKFARSLLLHLYRCYVLPGDHVRRNDKFAGDKIKVSMSVENKRKDKLSKINKKSKKYSKNGAALTKAATHTVRLENKNLSKKNKE